MHQSQCAVQLGGEAHAHADVCWQDAVDVPSLVEVRHVEESLSSVFVQSVALPSCGRFLSSTGSGRLCAHHCKEPSSGKTLPSEIRVKIISCFGIQVFTNLEAQLKVGQRGRDAFKLFSCEPRH